VKRKDSKNSSAAEQGYLI